MNKQTALHSFAPISIQLNKSMMSRTTILTARRPSWSFCILTLCGLYCVFTICSYPSTFTFTSTFTSTQKRRNLRVTHQDLEFVHITKTGGTTIERIGCENGYKWGSMHYRPYFGCKDPDVDLLTWTSPHLQEYAKISPWHTPPKVLRTIVTTPNNPYAVQVDPYSGKTDKNLFTIVRNPYTRFVSEYYCPNAGYTSASTDVNVNMHDPAIMNHWIQQRIYKLQLHRSRYIDELTAVSNAGGNTDLVARDIHAHHKHFLNQVDYVYDDERSGYKIIDHVLHYENVEVEFNDLMRRYRLGITLPKKEEMDTYGTKGPKLTYRDLDYNTIEKINQWAGADFVAFGYKIITSNDFVMASNGDGNGGGGGDRDYYSHLRPLVNYDPRPRSGMCKEFIWNRDFVDCTRVDE